MAKIILTGKQTVNVSQDKAERIFAKWSDKRTPRDNVVDLGLKNFVQLGQIKQIDFQDSMISSPEDQKKSQERMDAIRDWNEYVKKCKAQSTEEKSQRMIRTFCRTLYNVRGNDGDIEGELFDNLMIVLLPWFDEHPEEWHAPAEVYQNLIPTVARKVPISTVPGIKSIGQIMADPKQEKSNIQRATCDICQKNFEYEGNRPLFCPKCQKQADNGELNLEIT